MQAQVARFGQLAFLVDAGQRRFRAFARARIPFSQVKTGGNAGIPADAILMRTGETKTGLAPGTRDNRGFDKIAVYAKIRGRLVIGIEQADRHQEQTALDAQAIAQFMLDIQLLDCGFALVTGRGDRMLPLKLGHHLGFFIEAMRDAKHGTPDIGLGLVTGVFRLGVINFAIAADDSFRPALLRGRRHYAIVGHGSGQHVLLLFYAGSLLSIRRQLGLDGIEFGREFFDFLQ